MSESKARKKPVQLRKRFIIVPALALLALLTHAGFIPIQEYVSAQKAARWDAYQTARDKGELETALKILNEVIDDTEPAGQDRYRLWRAELNHELGNADAAFDELDDLIKVDESTGAIRYRATLHYRAGRMKEAVRDIELLPTVARDVDDYGLLGVCKLSEPDEAIKILTEGIEHFEPLTKKDHYWSVKETLPKLYDLRATAYMLARDPEAALQDLNVVVDAGSPSATTLAIRARTLAELGQIDEATIDLHNALTLEEESAFLVNTRAIIQIAKHDFRAAQKTLEQCLQKFPDDKQAKTTLSLIRVGNGEGTEDEKSKAWGFVLEQALREKAEAP